MCSWDQQLAYGVDEVQRFRMSAQGERRGDAGERHRERRQTPAQDEPRPRTAELPAPRLGPRAFLEVFDRLVDHVAIDPPFLVGVAEEEAVVTDGVDEPWRSP